MKIKKWLTLSYVTVMLIPILTSIMLFFWMQSYNKRTEMDDYINNIKKFEKYDKLLSNKELFNNYPFNAVNLIDEEDKNNTKIEIYDRNGVRLSSSISENVYYPISREQLYSNLYEIDHGFKVDTLKKPVFYEGDLIGFYQITIVRTKVIQGVNNGTIVAISIFVGVFIAVLMLMIKLMDRKFNKPLLLLIDSIKDFAKGEETSIKYKSKDEIGELISHFNNMKREIKEKDYEIEKEQKSKEYMIAAISHDLKTPLTSIRAYAELIDSQREEDNKRYVSGILSKCDYMSNMLEDLLMYTILSSSYTMDFVDVDGEEFFQMLLSGYEEVCEKSNINYKTHIKVRGNYRVDVKQMIRVIDNLMSNAIRYTAEGKSIYMGAFSKGVSLPDWIDEEEKNKIEELRKDGVVILVKNQGEEIPKEDIERIMEPFYKVDNSRNKKVGTGLGLSIVKLIIDKHNGSMIVLSSKERGTLIACFIP